MDRIRIDEYPIFGQELAIRPLEGRGRGALDELDNLKNEKKDFYILSN